MYPKIFWGSILRSLRLQNHVTQKDLALLLHTSRQEISNLERGRKHPTPELIQAYSIIFDVNLTDHIDQCMPKCYKIEQLSFRKKLR